MSFLKEGNLFAKFFIKAAIPKQAFFLNKNEIFSEQILFLIFIGSAPGSRPTAWVLAPLAMPVSKVRIFGGLISQRGSWQADLKVGCCPKKRFFEREMPCFP